MKAFWFVLIAALAVAGVVCGRRIAEQRREDAFRRELEELPAPTM